MAELKVDMTALTAYVTKVHHKELKKLSAATGAPVTWYVRQGIENVLMQLRAPPKDC